MGDYMESYVVSRRVPNASNAISDLREKAADATSKEYLDGLLALPPEEQENWILADEVPETIARKVVGRPVLVELCWVVVIVTVLVVTVVKVWNAVDKVWENKEVKTTEKRKKKVQKTCPKK